MSGVELDALKDRLASILIDLTDDAEPRPSDTDIASAINDAMLALRRRAVPMEAVAWRWRIVGPGTQRLPWSYGADHPGDPAVLLNEGYRWTVQALAVIPAPGNKEDGR